MKYVVIVGLVVAGVFWVQQGREGAVPGTQIAGAQKDHGTSAASTGGRDRDRILKDAFDNRRSNLQVGGTGSVSRVLADDNEGSRHQRFILRLNSGQTLLVAHNIDLAPRINGLKKGDVVSFYGEYEWNEKGGVIHWTHHDPANRHVGGWLKHKGKTYR